MKKKTFRRFAACLMAVFVLILTAVPALAEPLTEEEGQSLIEETSAYVESIMVMSDDDLNMLGTYGDFYQISADQVRENREELGDFIAVKDGTWSQSGDNVSLLIGIECSNYDAEVEITFNAKEQEPKNLVINPDYPLSVNLANAGRNTLIGLIIVFLVLLFLAFVISLLKYTNASSRKKKKKKKAEQEEEPVLPFKDEPEKKEPEKVPEAETGAASAERTAPAGASEDEELIAVIAAAIAMASEEDPYGNGYVVRSIRKVGSAKRWKRA